MKSVSQLDYSRREFMAGSWIGSGKHTPLRTKESRWEALRNHSIWGNFEFATPFVSTTSGPDNVLWRARYHSKQSRGQVFVTVINIRARRRLGLPVLHAVDEMKHYGVPDPYERNYAFYDKHGL